MKLIQSFDISEGMSVNSLKPSINSVPEDSLDSCIMKEASVGDCILPKEVHSQNNGQKGLCLTDFDVGNATKKMFEQVDLNSSLSSSEVPLKKDSWSSGALYDKTSEKENMAESSEVRFEILSDDESESLHLKISDDDDENSVLDVETNEQNTSCSKQSHNSTDDDVSQDDLENENEDLHCGIPVYGQNPNDYSENDKELLNESLANEEEKGPLVSSDDGEAINALSTESDIEDISEEVGPIASSSKSLEVVSANVENISREVDDEVKSKSSEIITKRDIYEMSVTKVDTSDETSSDANKDVLSSTTEKKSQIESDCSENIIQLDENTEAGNDTKEGTNTSRDNERENHVLSDCYILEEKTTKNVPVVSISDETIMSDSSQDNVEINEIKENNEKKTEVNSNNENVEEMMDCDTEMEEIGVSVSNVGDKIENSKDVKTKGLMDNEKCAQEKLLNETNTQNHLENEISAKEDISSPENKLLEILEYEPVSEEGDELSEMHLDKRIMSPERHDEATRMDRDSAEPVESSELCSEQEEVKNRMPLLVENCDSKDSDTRVSTASDSEVLLVSSSESDSESSRNGKENLAKKEPRKVSNEIKNMNRSECDVNNMDIVETFVHKGSNEINKSVHHFEVDVKLVSEITNTSKKEPQAEHSEVYSGRKRTSNSEENLVNCSKRTKVAFTESNTEEECTVFPCEPTTDSEHSKKCVDSDAKEKCDNRIKRLPSSYSDTVDVKKIRVTPVDKKEKANEKTSCPEDGDVRLNVEKNSEYTGDSKSECEQLATKSKPLQFFRDYSRADLRKLTRNDLEELVLQKICEAITERSNCGVLREMAQSIDLKMKSWQKKAMQLTKQIKDLNLVLKRYGSDLQSKGPNAVPVKITRSVGLQVQMPGSSPSCGLNEDSTRRKTDKVQSSSVTTSTVSSTSSTPVKAGTTSPVAKSSSNAQKVPEGNEGQGPPVSSPQQSQLNAQPSGVKVPQTRPALVANPVATNPNKVVNKPPPTSVNNRVKSLSDLQVIDLTDAEDKTKNIAGRSLTAHIIPTTSATTVPSNTTTTSTTTISTVPSNIATTPINNVGRSIRVVQQLGGSNTSLLTQSATNAVTGQRVTYFMPTATVPVQPRQLIISSASQVRPAGVVTMTNRQNPIPTIVLKPGQVVPVTTVAASGPNIIRTQNVNNSIQLTASRAQPRTGQLFQRISTTTTTATPVQAPSLSVPQSLGLSMSSVSHPAPLPPIPLAGPGNANWKLPPPKPDLKISKVPNRNQQGIVLSWNMTVTNEFEEIASYQLFAYQEGPAPPSTHLWKKVGDVKALPLPMACTLTQFMEGHKYHFAVRAVDIYARYGPFSAPGNIVLTRN